MIKSLALKNFRTYENAEAEFSARRVILSGANGAGKTNILEAIFFLTMLRSFRTSLPRDMIRHGESAFSISGLLERGVWQEKLDLTYAANGDRLLRRNGEKVRKSSNFIGQALPVAFIPEDIQLISGSGSGRRRFMDMYISMLDHEYQTALYTYNSALAQRNAALKRASRAAAAAFEPILAETGVYITRRRRIHSGMIAAEVCRLLENEPETGFAVQYAPSAAFDSVDAYRENLARDLPKDIKRGITAAGPQLDDFIFQLNGQQMRAYASNGQRRKLAIYLKLAAYAILQKNLSGRKTALVVLVDDVTGELDSINKTRFFELIKSADQAFFTFTCPEDGPQLPDSQHFQVEPGKIIQL